MVTDPLHRGSVATMATAARAPSSNQVSQDAMPRKSANRHTRPVTAMPAPTPENTQPALSGRPMALSRARHSEAVATSTQARATPASERQAIQVDQAWVQPIMAVLAATSSSPTRNSVDAFQRRKDAERAPAK